MQGGCENGQGGALYDTAMLIYKGGAKTVRGVHYMTQQGYYVRGGAKTVKGVKKRSGGCII